MTNTPRDPARIPRILALLATCWERNPQLRLGQIVGNLADDDVPYYVEDDTIEIALRTWLDEDERRQAGGAS